MVDLFVTFPKEPKNENRLRPTVEHFKKNIDGYDFFVFKIGNSIPNKAYKGDRCYVGFNNKVHGYFLFHDARSVSEEESRKFGNWDGSSGNFLFCDYATYQELLLPKPDYKVGFIGFRYYQDEINKGNITLNS